MLDGCIRQVKHMHACIADLWKASEPLFARCLRDMLKYKKSIVKDFLANRARWTVHVSTGLAPEPVIMGHVRGQPTAGR